MKCLALLFVIANIASAQNTPNVQAKTSGMCSSIVLNNQGKVQIRCDTAMDEATRRKILILLNQILDNTKDTNATNKKLDTLLEYVTHLNSGNNSPSVGSISQGAGSALSFNQQGGITAGTIIGALTPPPRQLSFVQIRALSDLAIQHPFAGKVLILYIENNDEAYQLAKQIGDALTAGGWTLAQPVTPAAMLSAGGPPAYGMEIDFQGEKVAPGASVNPDPNTPAGALIWALYRMFPKDFAASPSPTQTQIVISVHGNRNTTQQ